MVKKAQLLEDAIDLTDRIRGRIVKKEQAFGSSSKPTNGKKRPFSITDEPSQEQKPKVFTPSARNKPKCKHYDKLGHTSEECWRKVGACLCCGSREHRIPDCPYSKKMKSVGLNKRSQADYKLVTNVTPVSYSDVRTPTGRL
ncbi:hypothetical protein Taro_052263 [Colocasia esculenta]|uniref:CCHC-type domain-containing protein n=1 Tax=Colocasia esculenta TaxID=4460 RepID=A0A843XJ69_COLES|nr:hypothetical protein [Colocasia esculenta]